MAVIPFIAWGLVLGQWRKNWCPIKKKIKRPAIVKKNGDVAKIVGIKTYR